MGVATETRESEVEHIPACRGWWSRLIPTALVVTAVVLIALIAMMPDETPPPPATEVPPINVKVLRIQAVPELPDTLDLTAVVEPDRVVRVAAEVAGRIEKFGDRPQRAAGLSPRGDTDIDAAPLTDGHPRGSKSAARGATVQEGDPIARGDPIVHLNKDLLQAGFKREQAQFEYDQREYRRLLDLFEREASSKTELDDARTRRDVSKAVLEEAAAHLERAAIVAPISGTLNRLPMEIGEYVSSGDCVAEIVDIARAKIVVDVPERDVHYLHVGDVAKIFLRTPQPRELAGEIAYISELADEHTRTTRLEIMVDNHDHALRSGQIVRARLTRRVLTNAIMIPLSAVIPLENDKAVYIVNDDDRAERRLVELGFIKERSVRILSGLATGDRLIVSGHRYVGPDQPVAVVEEQ